MLVFQFWLQGNPLQLHLDQGSTALQVELVKADTKAKESPIVKIAPPTEAKQIEPVEKFVTKALKATTREIAKVEQIKPELPQPVAEPQAFQQPNAVEKAEQVAYLPEAEAEPESTKTAGAMPADVQQMILTHISYPRKARRKGWQGRATFDLAVYEQKLAQLDLFHSSGFTLLDKAAIRGIKAINRLPLANGLYRLPVEFRLQ